MQGDGSAQLLCRDEAAAAAVCEILERDLGVHCLRLTVPPTDPDGPAEAAAPAAAAAERPASTTPAPAAAARDGLAEGKASYEVGVTELELHSKLQHLMLSNPRLKEEVLQLLASLHDVPRHP
jgi:hypothetical protein